MIWKDVIAGFLISGFVIVFVYADLITIPVLSVYRKYYGWKVMLYIPGIFFVTMAFTGFLMEELFNVLGIVPDLAGGQTASEQTYFELNYTFYLNIIAFALSGFLLYVYRRGLGLDAPGQYRDPVCGMRTDDSGPSLTHDGEVYYFCSKRCKRSFENHPNEFAQHHPEVSGAESSQSHEYH